MDVLFITKDAGVLRENTAARKAIEEYAGLADLAFVIVLNTGREHYRTQKISEKLWIFPTNSWTWWLSPYDAIRVARKELWFQKRFQTELMVALDPSESGMAGWLIQRFAQKPLVMEIMQNVFSRLYVAESTANLLRSYIARLVLPSAQKIRVGSENIRTSLSAVSAPLAEESFLLPRFIDVEHLMSEPVHADLHKKYPAFKFIVLMVVPLVLAYNIDLALRILKDLLQTYRHVGLVVVGEGKDRKRLEELADSLGIAAHVVFEKPGENMSSYYKTTNLFLTTAVDEAYGDTLAEAAAHGCPIVTTKVGLTSVIVEHGDSGFICDPARPETFVKSILDVINHPGLRDRMRVNGALFLAHSVARNREEYLRTLKELWWSAAHSSAEEDINTKNPVSA